MKLYTPADATRIAKLLNKRAAQLKKQARTAKRQAEALEEASRKTTAQAWGWSRLAEAVGKLNGQVRLFGKS